MSDYSKILTVTIPSYNVEKYLPVIIPTYLESSILEDIEILIVNDGSKDDTAKLGLQFEQEYPGTVKVVNKENGGHGSTINKGIEIATGKYFKVIDGDDWVDTKGFVKLINELKNCDADLVMNSFDRVNIDSGESTRTAINGLISGKIYSFDDILPSIIDNYQLHSNTYKLSVLKDMKRIDEHCFYVDQEYIVYPIDRIQTVVYLDFDVYQYRVGNAEQSMSLKSMQKNRDMHKRVIFSLLGFLKENKHSKNVENILAFKVRKMSQIQIDTYFSMERSKEIRRELFSFLAQLKLENPVIYGSVPGKKAALLRMVGPVGYDLVKLLKR